MSETQCFWMPQWVSARMDNPPPGWTAGDERALVAAHSCKVTPAWEVYLKDKVGLPCCEQHVPEALKAMSNDRTWDRSVHVRPIGSDHHCRHQDDLAAANGTLVRRQAILDEVTRSLDAAGVPGDAPIPMRVDALVKQRDELYEVIRGAAGRAQLPGPLTHEATCETVKVMAGALAKLRCQIPAAWMETVIKGDGVRSAAVLDEIRLRVGAVYAATGRAERLVFLISERDGDSCTLNLGAGPVEVITDRNCPRGVVHMAKRCVCGRLTLLDAERCAACTPQIVKFEVSAPDPDRWIADMSAAMQRHIDRDALAKAKKASKP